MTIVLAIDTASPRFAVAAGRIGAPDTVIEREASHDHSRLLLPAIAEVLGGERRELEAVVVITGPGSYAGVRVGVATAQGLAEALEAPVFGVGTLEAAAATLPPQMSATVIHPAGRGEFAAQEWMDGRPSSEIRVVPPAALSGSLAGEGAGALGGREVGPGERVAAALRLFRDATMRDAREPGADVTYLREPNITVSRRGQAPQANRG